MVSAGAVLVGSDLAEPKKYPLNAATIIAITINIESIRLMALEVSKVFNRDSVDKKYFKLLNKRIVLQTRTGRITES